MISSLVTHVRTWPDATSSSDLASSPAESPCTVADAATGAVFAAAIDAMEHLSYWLQLLSVSVKSQYRRNVAMDYLDSLTLRIRWPDVLGLKYQQMLNVSLCTFFPNQSRTHSKYSIYPESHCADVPDTSVYRWIPSK